MTTSIFKAARAYEHYLKYDAIAKRVGVAQLALLVPWRGDEIRSNYTRGDVHLTAHPFELRRWDCLHHHVVRLATSVSGRCVWSLSYSVSVLKHVALYYLAGIEPPPDVSDELSVERRAAVAAEVLRTFSTKAELAEGTNQ